MSASAAPAVGVLGGTFDPVHLGHLRVAESTGARFGLARVLVVPTAVPPHKPRASLAAADHRTAMLRLALEGHAGLVLSTLELGTDRAAYTIDTLRALRDGVEACCPVFILGADALLQLPSWREHRGLLREFDLVAVDRAGHAWSGIAPELAPGIRARLVTVPVEGDPAELEILRPGDGGRIFHFPLTPSPISSSAVRERARRGDDLRELVPPGVARYIQDMGLYREEAGR